MKPAKHWFSLSAAVWGGPSVFAFGTSQLALGTAMLAIAFLILWVEGRMTTS